MADSEQTPGDPEQGPSTGEPSDPPAQGGAGGEASEEELRAQLEEEIRKVRVEDVVLQGAVSVLNLSARRIAKEDERDLEQARIGIEAARALADLVPEQARPQLRQAVSELQLMYAKHAGEGGDPAGAPGGGSGDAPASEGAAPAPEGAGSGPAAPKKPEGSSGLWTPHERN